MSNLHWRYPWLVTVALALAFTLLAVVGTPLGNWIEAAARLPQNTGILIQQALLVVFSAGAVTVFGGWRRAGFARPVHWRSALLFLPLLIAPVIILARLGIAVVDPVQLALLVVFTLMIGFAEEALCRGVMLGAFLPRGPVRAAVLSSLIFGSMHLVNLFYGLDLVTALLYVIYAALIGFGLAAPFLRGGGAIWPAIAVHSLFDFIGKLAHGWGAQAQPTSSFEVVVRLGAAVLVGLYAAWLLRGARAAPAAAGEPVVAAAASQPAAHARS
jgi:membrane protease YdiL (CAAX protease family)